MSVGRLLHRVRAMDRAEFGWRAAVAARTTGQRLQARVSPPAWNRVALEQILAPGVSAGTLAAGIRGRAPRFILDPRSRDAMRAAILARWPDAARAAATRADRILDGSYDLLGYHGLRFGEGGAIDWHSDPVHGRRAPRLFWADVPYLDPAIGDHKIIWELNRHQHWLALGRAYWLTGDARYRDRIPAELESWLAANPPLTGINWASMLEIGFRAMSWLWAIHFINHDDHEGHDDHDVQEGHRERRVHRGRRGSTWLHAMLVALHAQLNHLEQNLSYYFSPNTHLTGEALALYVVGSALPELRASERWRQTGRRILLTEIDRQILPDGGHAERSTHYQRYTLDFYLLAMMTAQRAGDLEAAERFSAAAVRLARFTRAMADDEGRLPLIGDDDGGMLWPIAGRACADVRDSLALAAVELDEPALAPWPIPEEVVWIAGPARAGAGRPADVEPAPSTMLRDTGFVVLRSGAGDHAVLDAGAHGYMNAGHAHADALSLTLTVEGRPLLVDPGTSTYTMDPALRDRMRSSVSHNTLTIDGLAPAQPAGPFHWRSRVDARLVDGRINPAFDWAQAEHDGYAPITLRRQILRTAGDGWFIVDEVRGSGEHAIDAHWHFDPTWTITAEGEGTVRATHAEGGTAWLVADAGTCELARGDQAAGLGWHAPVYGVLVPAWTARLATRGPLPRTLVTWIGDAGERPVLTREGGAGGAPLTLRLRRGGRLSTLVLGGEHARVAHVAEDDDGFRSLSVVRLTGPMTAPRGTLALDVSEAVSDLHVAFDGVTLDIAASQAPATLRLHGPILTRARAVRLNGRALPQSANPSDGSLLIHGVEWALTEGAEGTDSQRRNGDERRDSCTNVPPFVSAPSVPPL